MLDTSLLNELKSHRERNRPHMERQLREIVAAAAHGVEPSSWTLYATLDELGMTVGDFRAAVARFKQGTSPATERRPAATVPLVQAKPVSKPTVPKHAMHVMPSPERLMAMKLEIVEARLDGAQKRLDSLTANYETGRHLAGDLSRLELASAAAAEVQEIEKLRSEMLSTLLNM